MAQIPTKFMRWLVESRIHYLKQLLRGEPITYFSAHLPVVATWSDEGDFCVNLTAKGIGLLPREEFLDSFINLFEKTLSRAKNLPWNESWEMRVETLFKLYEKEENFDPSILGGLEIFEGRTLKNLRKNPRASLLYVGLMEEKGRVSYISFQLNTKVKIVGKDSKHYRFLVLVRKLFELDRFHIYQPDYPYGYIFKIEEVLDKTPWSRAGSR